MSMSSFWDRNPQFAAALPPYLGESEKQSLVAEEMVFVITTVIPEPNSAYQGKPTPRWSLIIEAPEFADETGDPRRTVTFPMNPTRDTFMTALKEWLDGGNPAPNCVLGWYLPKGGGSGFYTINPAPDTTADVSLDTSKDASK